MKSNLLLGLVALVMPSALQALTLPKIFSSDMVLQRDNANPIWGWSEPGTTVVVAFAGQQKTAIAAEGVGRWQVKLDGMEADAEGREMLISAVNGKSITLQNILVGDVWICSGQSNMEWAVKQASNPNKEIAAAKFPNIRLFNVAGHDISSSPQRRLRRDAIWQPCSPQTVADFSAVGYYFGRELLQKGEQIPIGLIGTNWGGTRIEPWTPPIGFRMQPELAKMSKKVDAGLLTTPEGKANWLKYANEMAAWNEDLTAKIESGGSLASVPDSPGPKGHGEPCSIFNAMVAPIVGYGVRGAIWYQGESNSGEGIHYLPKLKALVQGWRSIWDQTEDSPFYFYVVKLAQFRRADDNPEGGNGFARVRVAQDRIQQLPHTGVVSAIDIGDASDIHPKNKQDVGKRLALWALRDVYQQDVVVSGPSFKNMRVEGIKAVIEYDHIGGGLIVGKKEGLDPVEPTPGAKLARFAIAGADKKWHWAEAEIVGDQVHVSSASVTAPVAVRYAYSGNPDGANLYNQAGLPAVPFRTDEWKP